MSFYNKVKWVLGILLVFILIMATNLIDRDNFVTVRNSVVTIYEDRLIAKDLILEITKSIHEKELALAVSDTGFFSIQNTKVNDAIRGFITRYEQTKLTEEESRVFNDFKENFQDLQNAEKAYAENGFDGKEEVIRQISGIKENLADLSKIQLIEGSRQVKISQRAVDMVELFTQMEIYLLIFLAIVIQIIVIYNPGERKNEKKE